MKRGLPFALAALLLVPAASAQETPEYPPELVALLPAWIERTEGLAREGDRDRPWWPDAEEFLIRAKEATDQKRFRIALFHLETYAELVVAHQLMDQAASFGSDAERRTFVLQRTAGWKEDADREWRAYRERLSAYDGELSSLHALENALYSADLALTAALTASDHLPTAREFPKQPGFPEGYVLALVRASHTPLLALSWCQDLLEEAAKQEGLPPRIDEARWDNITDYAVSLNVSSSQFREELTKLANEARNASEGTLSVAFTLAEQRADRTASMQTMFGDGATRGLDVVGDATRGMRHALNNTTMRDARDRSLAGVFAADARDRALYTLELVETNRSDLGSVIVAWAGLEHVGYVNLALGNIGPTPPQPDPFTANDTEHPVGQWWDGYRHRDGREDYDYYRDELVTTKSTPAPGLLALVGIGAVLAALARRRG